MGVLASVVLPDCVKLNPLFILPEHRGRGVGRQCLLLLTEEARELGLPIRLQVLKVDPRALAFYQRLGLERTGETETHDLLEWTPSRPSTPLLFGGTFPALAGTSRLPREIPSHG